MQRKHVHVPAVLGLPVEKLLPVRDLSAVGVLILHVPVMEELVKIGLQIPIPFGVIAIETFSLADSVLSLFGLLHNCIRPHHMLIGLRDDLCHDVSASVTGPRLKPFVLVRGGFGHGEFGIVVIRNLFLAADGANLLVNVLIHIEAGLPVVHASVDKLAFVLCFTLRVLADVQRPLFAVARDQYGPRTERVLIGVLENRIEIIRPVNRHGELFVGHTDSVHRNPVCKRATRHIGQGHNQDVPVMRRSFERLAVCKANRSTGHLYGIMHMRAILFFHYGSLNQFD